MVKEALLLLAYISRDRHLMDAWICAETFGSSARIGSWIPITKAVRIETLKALKMEQEKPSEEGHGTAKWIKSLQPIVPGWSQTIGGIS